MLLGTLLAVVPGPETTALDAQSYPERWGYRVEGAVNQSSSPGVGDVNGNGRSEIVYGDQGGWLRVLDATTGGNIPGFPQQVGTAIDSSPAIADVTGNGQNEIIVGVGSTWVPNQQGGLVIYRRNGQRHCRFTTADQQNIWTEDPRPDGYAEGVFSTPAIGDITGNGRPEIVFGGWDQKIHAIDGNCNSIPGFPYHVDDTVWSSPALYDIDGDGRLEIFIGGDQSPGAGSINWQGGEFRALDYRNGRVHEIWKRQIRDVIHSSPAIGDINGDGRMEVVVGGGNAWGHSDGRRLWVWRADNGGDVAGWAGGKDLGGVVRGSPVLGDLTGNGRPEIVVTSRDGAVYAFRGDGQQLWRRPGIANCCIPPGALNSSPIIADMTGNGRQDVVFGNAWGYYILNGANGNVIAGPLNHGHSSENSPAIGDFGSAGRLLVVTGFSQPNNRHRIAAYQVPGTTAPAWPQWRRTANNIAAPRSGGNPLPPGQCSLNSNPSASPSTASARGYWVLGRSGGVYSYGDAPFHGSLGGSNAVPSVAMAARSDARGYWIVDERGRVHPFGAARFHGDMRGTALNGPIIGFEPTPSGNGYWLLGRDGGIFSFGDAAFYGSMGGTRLNSPVISISSTPSGRGYWLLGADGGIFSFGDAAFYGSTGGMRLNAPVISMSVNPNGTGYWLLGADGGVFTFGRADFHGSIPGLGLCNSPQAVQLRSTATGKGYWLLSPQGGIYTFGDARFLGAPTGHVGNGAVDMVIRP